MSLADDQSPVSRRPLAHFIASEHTWAALFIYVYFWDSLSHLNCIPNRLNTIKMALTREIQMKREVNICICKNLVGEMIEQLADDHMNDHYSLLIWFSSFARHLFRNNQNKAGNQHWNPIVYFWRSRIDYKSCEKSLISRLILKSTLRLTNYHLCIDEVLCELTSLDATLPSINFWEVKMKTAHSLTCVSSIMLKTALFRTTWDIARVADTTLSHRLMTISRVSKKINKTIPRITRE